MYNYTEEEIQQMNNNLRDELLDDYHSIQEEWN